MATPDDDQRLDWYDNDGTFSVLVLWWYDSVLTVLREKADGFCHPCCFYFLYRIGHISLFFFFLHQASHRASADVNKKCNITILILFCFLFYSIFPYCWICTMKSYICSVTLETIAGLLLILKSKHDGNEGTFEVRTAYFMISKLIWGCLFPSGDQRCFYWQD